MDDVFDENNGQWPAKYSQYEQECINFIESMPDTENELEIEKLNYEQKLWNYFQSSAIAIAQLYSRDNLGLAHNLWNTFQLASTNVACLYKESAEHHKRMYDVYHQNGYHKRTKEMLTWVKKKKNLIRREDLISFLSGHHGASYLHNNRYYHRMSRASRSHNNDEISRLIANSTASSRNNSRFILNEGSSLNNPDDLSSNPVDETNLETFKGAISDENLKTSTVFLNTANSNKRNLRGQDLSEFIDQQYHRHVESRKRTSSMDVCMDPPNNNCSSNKRIKFY